MRENLERYRRDLETSARLGEEMLIDLSLRGATVEPEQREFARRIAGSFERNYQRWYTEASAVVGQLIPGRAAEFELLYQGDGKRKSIDAAAYNIQDWLVGRRLPAGRGDGSDGLMLVSMRLKTQLDILKSAAARFESSLLDIRQLVRADLFDSELDACRELSSRGFLRAAGSIAGVLLEKHLRRTVESRGAALRKAEPTIGDYNDQLKRLGVIDVPAWRQIQRLADVRNLCNHSKHREPHKKEVDELIDGVDRIVRTLF